MSATVVLDRYCPELFESLPSVKEAEARLASVGGLANVAAALATVARQHDSSNEFGIQLLHRHSALEKDEVMLAHGATTVPTRKGDLAAADSVYATVWGIRPGSENFVPLEFAHANEAMPDLDVALATDVAHILIDARLDHILGLARIQAGETVGLESTYGRANVVLPMHLFAKPARAIEVLWSLTSFASDSYRRCQQYCNTDDQGEHVAWGHIRI